MKNKSVIILSIILEIALPKLEGQRYCSLNVSDSSYINQMHNLLMEFDTLKSSQAFIEIAGQFLATASMKEDCWLSYYYVSYSWAIASSNRKPDEKTDKYLDFAEEYLKKAQYLSPDESEILCLKGLINSLRIQVDPAGRGMKYIGISNELLKKAIEINNNNPRAYYLLGRNFLGMPKGFGGGNEVAIKYFKKADEIYKTVTLSDKEITPHWGQKENTKLLNKLSNTQ